MEFFWNKPKGESNINKEKTKEKKMEAEKRTKEQA